MIANKVYGINAKGERVLYDVIDTQSIRSTEEWKSWKKSRASTTPSQLPNEVQEALALLLPSLKKQGATKIWIHGSFVKGDYILPNSTPYDLRMRMDNYKVLSDIDLLIHPKKEYNLPEVKFKVDVHYQEKAYDGKLLLYEKNT